MTMSLRLPDEVADQLRAASAEEGVSMNGVAVIAISEWLERRKDGHVLGVADDIMRRHAALLDRLGNS